MMRGTTNMAPVAGNYFSDFLAICQTALWVNIPKAYDLANHKSVILLAVILTVNRNKIFFHPLGGLDLEFFRCSEKKFVLVKLCLKCVSDPIEPKKYIH